MLEKTKKKNCENRCDESKTINDEKIKIIKLQ